MGERERQTDMDMKEKDTRQQVNNVCMYVHMSVYVKICLGSHMYNKKKKNKVRQRDKK